MAGQWRFGKSYGSVVGVEAIVFIDDDIAEVDADAECNELIFVAALVACSHDWLNFDHALGGFDDRWEFEQQTIAHGLDDATAVFVDFPVDQLSPMGTESSKRAGLVNAHEA